MKHGWLLAIVLAGCAPAPFRLEATAPDPARLAALLAAPVAHAKPSTPATFALSVPRIILEGNAFRVTCYVPESLGPGYVRVALEGVQVSGPKQIAGIETSLVVRPSCGQWKATCQVSAEHGQRYAEQDVEVKGGMCEGSPQE